MPCVNSVFLFFFFFTGLSVFYFDELKLLFTKRADIGRLAPWNTFTVDQRLICHQVGWVPWVKVRVKNSYELKKGIASIVYACQMKDVLLFQSFTWLWERNLKELIMWRTHPTPPPVPSSSKTRPTFRRTNIQTRHIGFVELGGRSSLFCPLKRMLKSYWSVNISSRVSGWLLHSLYSLGSWLILSGTST